MIAQAPTQQLLTRPTPAAPQSAAEWAARIVQRHPALARPVADALALVEAGHVTATGNAATVRSSSDGTTTYRLRHDPATGAWHCNCPAYAYRPAMIGRTAYCKHTLARSIAERAGLLIEAPAAVHVVRAVHTQRLSEGRRRCYATVADTAGHERPVTITQAAYDELRARADSNDDTDGDYAAFNRPIEWSDVFAEDR